MSGADHFACHAQECVEDWRFISVPMDDRDLRFPTVAGQGPEHHAFDRQQLDGFRHECDTDACADESGCDVHLHRFLRDLRCEARLLEETHDFGVEGSADRAREDDELLGRELLQPDRARVRQRMIVRERDEEVNRPGFRGGSFV
jgi:hypothetical protein